MKNHQEEFYPAALTISASDSGGGSGIQADLRTFNAAGVYGCSAITVIAARSHRQTAAFSALEPELVKQEIECVLSDVAIKAVKLGVLANSGIAQTVAEVLKKHKLPVIASPAMFSNNGDPLLDTDSIKTVQNTILPLADMIILNIPEAEYLAGHKLKNENDYADAAMLFADKYQCNILLTTGHAIGSRIGNVAVIDKKLYLLSHPSVSDQDEFTFYGMTCTLSSGITAMVAAGNSWKDALVLAMVHLFGAMSETAHIGKNLDVMYPPLEDYSRAVTIRSMQKKQESKGVHNAR